MHYNYNWKLYVNDSYIHVPVWYKTFTGNGLKSAVGVTNCLIAILTLSDDLFMGQKHCFWSVDSHLTGTTSTWFSSVNSTTAYLYTDLCKVNFAIKYCSNVVKN